MQRSSFLRSNLLKNDQRRDRPITILVQGTRQGNFRQVPCISLIFSQCTTSYMEEWYFSLGLNSLESTGSSNTYSYLMWRRLFTNGIYVASSRIDSFRQTEAFLAALGVPPSAFLLVQSPEEKWAWYFWEHKAKGNIPFPRVAKCQVFYTEKTLISAFIPIKSAICLAFWPLFYSVISPTIWSSSVIFSDVDMSHFHDHHHYHENHFTSSWSAISLNVTINTNDE